jgi:hypothetical protein
MVLFNNVEGNFALLRHVFATLVPKYGILV